MQTTRVMGRVGTRKVKFEIFKYMEESSSENELLHAQIKQLEHERDGLRKDMELLCMQKAGPDFIRLATQTFFRRTAGLEQEVENLKKKLYDCAKENSKINNELFEAKTIKAHLDQLHKLEVSKNAEVVKQLEYLRGAVPTAFDDRDRSLLEAEKAKENEELACQKLKEAEMRLQELSVRSAETEERVTNSQMKLKEQNQEIEKFSKVIDKFYKIRQRATTGSDDENSSFSDQLENSSWDEKCVNLYNDPTESWSFIVHQESSSANNVAALLQEVETLRGYVDDLQRKQQMGRETENQLKSRISILEQKKILSDRHIVDGISSLREYHNQQRIHITELLDGERSFQQSVVSSIDKKLGNLHRDIQASEATSSSMPNFTQVVDFSDTLAQALQDKVSAWIELSKQEERHIWEKSIHAAVRETVDELQRYLKLATHEKVKALMELAEVKQQYQQLLEKTSHVNPQGTVLGRTGTLKKSLSKLTSLRRLLGADETNPAVVHRSLEPQGFSNSQRSSHGMDYARLQTKYDTLKDSIHSLERLTSDVSKLRLTLIQAKMTARSLKGTSNTAPRMLDETIREAESLKNTLSDALCLSWSVEDTSSSSYVMVDENPKPEDEKIDTVSAAGLEMVELLIMAAQFLKEKNSKRLKIK